MRNAKGQGENQDAKSLKKHGLWSPRLTAPQQAMAFKVCLDNDNDIVVIVNREGGAK